MNITEYTSPSDLMDFLFLARGEAITIRIASGPGKLKVSLCGFLYDSLLQPVCSPEDRRRLHRFVVLGSVSGSARNSVEFSLVDVASICVNDNTIYLKP